MKQHIPLKFAGMLVEVFIFFTHNNCIIRYTRTDIVITVLTVHSGIKLQNKSTTF